MEIKQQTAIEYLIEQLYRIGFTTNNTVEHENEISIAKEMEMRLAIAFHNWMKENDTEQNAETYFYYSDEDMYNEFLKQWAK